MKMKKIGCFVDNEAVEKKDYNKAFKNEVIIFVEETDKEQIFKFIDSKEISKNELIIDINNRSSRI